MDLFMKLLNIIEEDDYMLLQGQKTEKKILSRESAQDFIDYMRHYMTTNDYTVGDIQEEMRGAVLQYLYVLMDEADKQKELPLRKYKFNSNDVVYKDKIDIRGYKL